MNIKPIIFSKHMIMAILAGTKTMTRRVVSMQPGEGEYYEKMNGNEFAYISKGGMSGPYKCPHGDPGDLLWVKETHYVWGQWVEDGKTKTGNQSWTFVPSQDPNHPVLFCDNAPDKVAQRKKNDLGYYRRPSIFLERKNARIFLQLGCVDIERVQDISEEDAIREGVLQYKRPTNFKTPKWLNYIDERSKVTQFIYNCDTAAESFRTLWMLIHGFRDEQFAWFKNPWVWVEGFRICTDADFDVIAAATKQISDASDHATDASRYYSPSNKIS